MGFTFTLLRWSSRSGAPHTIEAQLAKLTETPDPQKKVRSMAVFSPSQVLEPRFETRPFFQIQFEPNLGLSWTSFAENL